MRNCVSVDMLDADAFLSPPHFRLLFGWGVAPNVGVADKGVGAAGAEAEGAGVPGVSGTGVEGLSAGPAEVPAGYGDADTASPFDPCPWPATSPFAGTTAGRTPPLAAISASLCALAIDSNFWSCAIRSIRSIRNFISAFRFCADKRLMTAAGSDVIVCDHRGFATSVSGSSYVNFERLLPGAEDGSGMANGGARVWDVHVR